MTGLQSFPYDGHTINFDFTGTTLMVNATEMAKLFGKLPKDFLVNEQTKRFIDACLNKGNSPYLSIEKESDLYIAKPRTGTWMHRILALKFAAWLSPEFEIWIYETIDDILFGEYRRNESALKASAARKTRMETLKKELEDSEAFKELERLEKEERKATADRGKQVRTIINLFMQDFVNKEEFEAFA